MNAVMDIEIIRAISERQGGVFTTSDLRTALADPHSASLTRRVHRLIAHGVLRRFARGFYTATDFVPERLVCRMVPGACISFETVLAAKLVIGPAPTRRIVATKLGAARRFKAADLKLDFVSLSSHLMFGCTNEGGIRRADAEKAVLDTLYFHLRGRRYSFDVYSDLNLTKLDSARLQDYLARYPNPKFRAFAGRVLKLP